MSSDAPRHCCDGPNLGADDFEHLLFCVGAVQRGRREGRLPGNPHAGWLIDLIRRLELEVATMSHSGHGSGCPQPESEATAWVTASEAATIIGLSKRQTTRLAQELDGEIIGGRWLFPLQAVAEYAEGRRETWAI